MSNTLSDLFFDLLLRTLNLSMEFSNEKTYASTRFMDVFGNLLQLQPMMSEISQEDFYEKIREKIKDRELIRDQSTRPQVQEELLQMFVDEWKRRSSDK